MTFVDELPPIETLAHREFEIFERYMGVDSAALTKTARTFIELAIAAAVEPAVKRELRKELAKLETGQGSE